MAPQIRAIPIPENLPEPAREGIFILGICRRSGTNFLSDLLGLHPECSVVEAPPEDFLLENAGYLQMYADAVGRSWKPKWDPEGNLKSLLLTYLTASWIPFLAHLAPSKNSRTPRYVVTKTPSVKNLDLVSRIPNAKILVLIRDGRDVVASAVSSFDDRFETATQTFAQGARTIVAAKEKNLPFMLVRYEALCRNLSAEMTKIFAYLDISPELYDFSGAANLPVRGSGTFGRGLAGLNFSGVAKTHRFRPIGQWHKWTTSQHELFNAIAEKENALLGYESNPPPRWKQIAPRCYAFVQAFLHRFADV